MRSGLHRARRARAVRAGRHRWVHRLVRGAELTFLAGVLAVAGLVALHLASPSRALAAPRPTRALSRRAGRHPSPPPLTVTAVSPAPGSTGVGPTATVTVDFSAPLLAGSPLPSLSPPEAGRWQRVGRTELAFRPSSPVLPLTTETLSVPDGPAGVRGRGDAELAAPVVDHWQVRDGSVLRLQQVLASLGYLPLTWTPTSPAPSGPTEALAALYAPPAGQFAWRYPNTPTTLEDAWSEGVDDRVTTGAMVAFEVHDGLPGYTSIRPILWPYLLAAEAADRTNPEGYTYALVSQATPETLTLWHDGADVFSSLVNTGIAATPTPVGTYFIYRRFASTTMSGTNPNGTYYLDHGVRWVNYFDGGVAIHGFVRAAYGFPQSLGCVELPLPEAAAAWHDLHYGTVVTVLPEPTPPAGAA